MTLTALLTVYHGNTPCYVQAALDSLVAQTRPADEILLVVDGPVPREVEETVRGFVDKQESARALFLSHNVGNGPASQVGLEAAHGEWVARLDADDIAAPERFATQLQFVSEHPEISVVGTWVAEFESDPALASAVRKLPLGHEEIARYAKVNSPINHPACMFKRANALAAGGYRDFRGMEDYDLWVRMLAHGDKFANIEKPLTYFRVDDAQFARRTGLALLHSDIRMQRQLVALGLVGRPRAMGNLVMRTTYRLLPERLLKWAYSKLFHE